MIVVIAMIMIPRAQRAPSRSKSRRRSKSRKRDRKAPGLRVRADVAEDLHQELFR